MRFRTAVCASILSVIVASVASAQQPTTAQVLKNLDDKAKVFTSLQAGIKNQAVNYGVKLPEETGKLTIAMNKSVPKFFWEVTDPKDVRKRILIDKGKGTVYFVSSNTYMDKTVDPNGEALQYLLLGFGASAATINKGYKAEVKGTEAVGSVQAVVLELTSISKATEEYPTVSLWLDPANWTPVQTRLSKSPKKYTDFKYSNVQLNRTISDSVFDLKMPKSATRQ